MTITTISFYIILSLILFWLLNNLEEKTIDNTNNRIIISLIYILIISGLVKNNHSIYLIIIFEFLIRILYNNYVLETDFFKENNTYLKEYFITSILAYLLNIYFINEVTNVFLTVSEFKIILWLFILLYIYSFINNNLKIQIKNDQTKQKVLNDEYYIVSYAKIKNRYSEQITTKNIELVPLIYSIMIYNNLQKPALYRKLDILKFRFDTKPRKFGIMQIKSKKIITDEESIELGIKKLDKLYVKYSKDEKNRNIVIIKILDSYYERKETSQKVIDIYNKIIKFNQK